MTIRVVIEDRDPSPMLALVVDALRAEQAIDPIRVPGPGTRNEDGSAVDSAADQFRHTPEPLLNSWYAAQHVLTVTRPGDIIVVSDGGGIGGVLSLTEASKPTERRRRVWTVAGDGAWLESTLIAGTTRYAEMPLASEIDWELIQYRSSEVVLTPSRLVADLLSEIDIEATLVDVATEAPANGARIEGTGVWIPGPVSRRNRSGDVLRALGSVPAMDATVSTLDSEDLIWSGSSWDALRSVRSALGPRLQRADRAPSRPAFLVFGDSFRVPDHETESWRDSGVPVLVPRGSTAAALWPEARVWNSSDDIVEILEGHRATRETAPTSPSDRSRATTIDESRARRVSVGIPVFRNVAFLDECLESILDQSQEPHEVLLVDDGSNSIDVDEALGRWEARVPDRVRVLTQTNRGVCVARNRMIDAMAGDSFVLVDQDDVLDPHFIERTAQALRQDEALWAVATWTEFFGSYEGVEAKPAFDRRVGLRENPIVSTAVLVDMRVRTAGLAFAPDLAFIYCEDWHYWAQIIAAGGRMGLVPEPLVKHRVHEASGGFQRTQLAHEIGKARVADVLLSEWTP